MKMPIFSPYRNFHLEDIVHAKHHKTSGAGSAKPHFIPEHRLKDGE